MSPPLDSSHRSYAPTPERLPAHPDPPPDSPSADPTPAPRRPCASQPPRCRASRTTRLSPLANDRPVSPGPRARQHHPPTGQSPHAPTTDAPTREPTDDDEPQDFDPTDDRWERLEAALADAFSDDDEQEHLWSDACRDLAGPPLDLPDDP